MDNSLLEFVILFQQTKRDKIHLIYIQLLKNLLYNGTKKPPLLIGCVLTAQCVDPNL